MKKTLSVLLCLAFLLFCIRLREFQSRRFNACPDSERQSDFSNRAVTRADRIHAGTDACRSDNGDASSR